MRLKIEDGVREEFLEKCWRSIRKVLEKNWKREKRELEEIEKEREEKRRERVGREQNSIIENLRKYISVNSGI